MAAKKKMNALDAAISKGKTLPSKNKKYPGDSDVGMKGFSKKPVIKVKTSADNKKQPISPKVTNKILSDSKKKAKMEVEKRKAPKTNWVTKIGSK